MANDNYVLTEEGKKKLEEELHYLENEKRAEIGERIKVAREFGDISENSEYDDAKNEQGMIDVYKRQCPCCPSCFCLWRLRRRRRAGKGRRRQGPCKVARRALIGKESAGSVPPSACW